MKKILPLLIILSIIVGCKKELAVAPKNLIAKEKMIAIMYDLSLLEAIKIQNSSSLDSFNLNSNNYIFKKYKIDSVQFAQSNIYYAADYKAYKIMYEKIKLRLEQNKTLLDSLIKDKKEKDDLLKKKAAKQKLKVKRKPNSIKKTKIKPEGLAL